MSLKNFTAILTCTFSLICITFFKLNSWTPRLFFTTSVWASVLMYLIYRLFLTLTQSSLMLLYQLKCLIQCSIALTALTSSSHLLFLCILPAPVTLMLFCIWNKCLPLPSLSRLYCCIYPPDDTLDINLINTLISIVLLLPGLLPISSVLSFPLAPTWDGDIYVL